MNFIFMGLLLVNSFSHATDRPPSFNPAPPLRYEAEPSPGKPLPIGSGGSIQVKGEAGRGQADTVMVYRCARSAAGKMLRSSCQLIRRGVLNERVGRLPVGSTYLVEFSGQFYPGWVDVQEGMTTIAQVQLYRLPSASDSQDVKTVLFTDLTAPSERTWDLQRVFGLTQLQVLMEVRDEAIALAELRRLCDEHSLLRPETKAICQHWLSRAPDDVESALSLAAYHPTGSVDLVTKIYPGCSHDRRHSWVCWIELKILRRFRFVHQPFSGSGSVALFPGVYGLATIIDGQAPVVERLGLIVKSETKGELYEK